MADYRVEYVTVGQDKHIPAEKAICPVCKVLDMGTGFNTSVYPWEARCSKGHEWTVKAAPDA